MLQFTQLSAPSKTTNETITATLTLPFDLRSKSRQRVTLSGGQPAAVVLPRGTVIRGGDVLATAEKDVKISVIAADEAVLFITARTPQLLLQGAYHLGNRHIPVEVNASYLAITADAVLADMLTLLGLTVQPAMRPFEPEHGAYSGHLGGGHKHGHDDTFAEDYALAQASFNHHLGDGITHTHV